MISTGLIMGSVSNVRPFRFKNLPKYSRESAALYAAFSRYLAASTLGDQVMNGIAREANEVLKAPVELYFDHMRPMSFEELSASIAENACLVRLALQPHNQRILWEIDPIVASVAVERLLGGRANEAALNRPFTDIEQGVLLYGLLRMARAFHTGLEQGTELAVRVEGVHQTLDPVRALYQEDEGFHVVAFKVAFGDIVSFSRLFIPTSLTAGAFSVPDEDPTSDAYWSNVRKNIQRIGDRWILGRIKVATLDMTPDDLHALGVGDIVLLENHELSGSPEELAGHAMVRLGRGKNGGLRTQLLWRNGSADLQIVSIVSEEEPQSMSDEQDPDAAPEGEVEEGGEAPLDNADNLQETEGLLRDVPAPVSIELGRLKLSTSQVVRLRAGQILRLGRSANDPVDLVVNNRIFARGELIEVDGELGVRLIQLAK